MARYTVKSRLHDTTGCQTGEHRVEQPVECLLTRCIWLFNQFDNRLYRVNGILGLGCTLRGIDF